MFDLNNNSFLLYQLFNNAQEGMIVTDDKARIIACNEAFCHISGYEADELIGENPSILSSGRQDKNFYKVMWASIQENGFWEGEVWNRKKDGSFYVELLSVKKIYIPDSDDVHYLGMMSDITKMKEHHASLEKLAHYDSLTGLPNRYLLEDRYEQAIFKANRNLEMVALCFLDLDDFKPVNDTYGHNVGDQLLVDLAQRLKSSLREEDTVSRYGGDEFIILLTGIHNRSDCEVLLKKILDIVETPFKIVDGVDIKVSASIGYTLYPFDKGSLESLIEHADQTLYQIKNSGKSDFLMYGETKEKLKLNLNTFSHSTIISAIDDKQLELFFQPKIDMYLGDIIGFEALIRWHHPEKGLLSPLEFLQSINETDVEIYLGHYVIKESIKFLSVMHAHGLKLRVSLNLSAYHISKNNFIEGLEEIFIEFPDIDLSYLQIEILESYAIDDLSSIKSVITQCRDAFGITMALDDFGTGYSSLSHIRNLPIKTIKIDQSFVRNMLHDPDDYKIVESVISLANLFNVEVIAEGVESIKHGQVLICMGCRFAQGYVFSKPIPSKDVLGWACNFYMDNLISKELSFVNNPRNISLRMLEHFIEIEFELFKKEIQSTQFPSKINLMDNTAQTHCEFWFERSKNNQLIEKDILRSLEQSYSILKTWINNTSIMLHCDDEESASVVYNELKEQYDIFKQQINSQINLVEFNIYQSKK